MAKFKCLISGNIIEFTNKVDIDSMEGHEGYVLVADEPAKAPTAAKKTGKTASVAKEEQVAE